MGGGGSLRKKRAQPSFHVRPSPSPAMETDCDIKSIPSFFEALKEAFWKRSARLNVIFFLVGFALRFKESTSDES